MVDCGDPFSFPPFQAVTDQQWVETESSIGYSLPPLLKLLYREVGNGGFGPGYGLRGVSGGMPDDNGFTLDEDYQGRRQGFPDMPIWEWPAGLIALNDWGCGITSCVDCRSESFQIVRFDPNGLRPEDAATWEAAFESEGMSFRDWIYEWAIGAELWKNGAKG